MRPIISDKPTGGASQTAAPLEPPAVEAQSLSKRYGDGKQQVVALADMSISVKRGEFLALLGPCGSGKTTTLMIIAGFETRGRQIESTAPITAVPPTSATSAWCSRTTRCSRT